MNGPILCGELLVDPVVIGKKAKPVKFQGFGSFPPALKDLALVVDVGVTAEEVRWAVQQAAEQAVGQGFGVDPRASHNQRMSSILIRIALIS